MKHIASLMLFLTLLYCGVASTATAAEEAAEESTTPAADRPVQILETKTGVEFGVWGELPAKPAPLLVVLAGTIEGTLGDAYFRQAGNQLGGEGCLVASLDLPCHGKQRRAGEPNEISGWRFRCERGDDFVAENNLRLSLLLDHLIEAGHVKTDQIAICGTSRGGFLAMHFAAHDARVNCVAAYAPVTDLIVVREFQGLKDNALLQSLAVHRRVKSLAGKGVWIVIGDRDERVGTDHAVSLAREITKESLAQGIESRVNLHVIAEPQGHTTPAGSAEQSAGWIRQQLAESATKGK